MNNLSEKQILILSILAIFLLATGLIYLMIEKDLSGDRRSKWKAEEKKQEVIIKPKIEIETSK